MEYRAVELPNPITLVYCTDSLQSVFHGLLYCRYFLVFFEEKISSDFVLLCRFQTEKCDQVLSAQHRNCIQQIGRDVRLTQSAPDENDKGSFLHANFDERS